MKGGTPMKLNSTLTCVFAVLLIALLCMWGCEKQSTMAPQAANDSQKDLSLAKEKKTASTGWDHGYYWQLYYVGGSASISFPGAGQYPGNFACSWNNVQDVVAGKGWNPGSARNIGYNCGALSGGYNFFGIYGWTTSPLIEYYVCEMGSVTYGASYVNSITSDGHTYGFYKHQQVNKPSIIGTATFWQYLDQWGGGSTGSSRSVNMNNHINNWRSRGGQGFGSYNLQILAVEAYNYKSGYCNATVW
jgi:endo-1,4-beta-xylanase